MNSKRADKIATIVFYAISIFIVTLLGAFIAYILYKGGSMLKPSFLFGKPKISGAGGGIGPQLFNSFYMLIISLLITIPIGIGAGGNLNNIGIYKLNEFMEFYSLYTPFEIKLKLLYGLFQYPIIDLNSIKNIFPDKYLEIYNKLLDFSQEGYLTIENDIVTLTNDGIYYGHSIDYEILKLCLI